LAKHPFALNFPFYVVCCNILGEIGTIKCKCKKFENETCETYFNEKFIE